MGWLLLGGFLVSALYAVVRFDRWADRFAWWWIETRHEDDEREWLRFNEAMRGDDPWQ